MSSFTNWRSKLSKVYHESGAFVEISPSGKKFPETYMELVIPSVGVIRLPETINQEALRHILLVIKEMA